MKWLENAKFVNEVCGSFVDWEEEFYICPECGDSVYHCDWVSEEMEEFICPICELTKEDIE